MRELSASMCLYKKEFRESIDGALALLDLSNSLGLLLVVGGSVGFVYGFLVNFVSLSLFYCTVPGSFYQ
jgi:hypothetical protein